MASTPVRRNPLDREIIWHDLKRARRSQDGTPPSAVDIALWDFAGKLYDAPIYELLGGGWRKKLPAYNGDENGGLATPDDFAHFALHCKKEYGYPAFKIHGWVNGPIKREVAAVLAIRGAVGDDMDLMLDRPGASPPSRTCSKSDEPATRCAICGTKTRSGAAVFRDMPMPSCAS